MQNKSNWTVSESVRTTVEFLCFETEILEFTVCTFKQKQYLIN